MIVRGRVCQMRPVIFLNEILRQCWFLSGPTACGKTALSLTLANQLNAEIIALDSMTVYRGMDVGTAKATRFERDRVPHHLIDILAPHEEFSLTDYLEASATCCLEILSRGRTPLFVGGTGLYLRSLLRGVFEGPKADWELRRELEQRAIAEGRESLHRELSRIDPVTASRLHPNDLRRVVRAIEVQLLTGRTLSEQQEQGPRPLSERTPHVYWLSPNRDWLNSRIDARVEQMFQQGFLAEVRLLRDLPQPLSRTARQALGYRDVLDWMDAEPVGCNGRPDLEASPPHELVALIQTHTRQFAKRQLTWFRNLEECIPIEIDSNESTIQSVDRLLNSARTRS